LSVLYGVGKDRDRIKSDQSLSAFGAKADMTVCGNSLSRSLFGVKRTWAGVTCLLLTQSGHLSGAATISVFGKSDVLQMFATRTLESTVIFEAGV